MTGDCPTWAHSIFMALEILRSSDNKYLQEAFLAWSLYSTICMKIRAVKIRKLISYILGFLFLCGFTAGDKVQLNLNYNARSSMRFVGNSNILGIIPKGTIATVTQVRKFYSGNHGVQIKYKDGQEEKTAWVYDWSHRKDDIAKCLDESCKQTTESYAHVSHIQTKENQATYRDPAAAEEIVVQATEEQMRRAGILKTDEAESQSEADNCDNCETESSPGQIVYDIAQMALDMIPRCSVPSRPENPVITSQYGMRRHPITRQRAFHSGLDLRGRLGEPVYASMDGIVQANHHNGGYGNQVILRHEETDGWNGTTSYSHMKRRGCSALQNLTVGTRVKKGQQIGCAGSTGSSTASHLHFEIRDANNSPLNPYRTCGFDKFL